MGDINAFYDATYVDREAVSWWGHEDDDKDLFFFSDWWDNGTFNYDEYESDMSAWDSKIQGYSDIAFTTFLTSTVVNVVIFLVFMIAYELLRRCFPNVYASRREKESKLIAAREHAKELNEQHGIDDVTVSVVLPTLKKNRRYSKHLPEISKAYMPLEWVGKIFGVSWRQVREAVGLDGYFYLRYIRMCLKITSVSALWGAIVLFPTYASGDNDASGWYHVSMANVSQGSSIIWVSIVYIYFFTFFVLYVMKQEYKHFVELRLDFLGKGNGLIEPQNQYSVMVENIPKELRGDNALYNYFDKLFPGKVHSASVILKIPKLEALSRNKLDATKALEKSIAYYQATRKRPTHITGRPRTVIDGIEMSPVDLWFDPEKVVDLDMHYRSHDSVQVKPGSRVDSIEYYTRQLRHINNKMFLLQKERGEQAVVDGRSLRGFDKWFNTLSLYVDKFFLNLGTDSKDEDEEGQGENEGENRDDGSYDSDSSSEVLGISSSEESDYEYYAKPLRKPSTPWDHPDTKEKLMMRVQNDTSTNSGKFGSVVRFADEDNDEGKSKDFGNKRPSSPVKNDNISGQEAIKLHDTRDNNKDNRDNKKSSDSVGSVSAITDNSAFKKGLSSNRSIQSNESKRSTRIGMVLSHDAQSNRNVSPTNRKERMKLFQEQNSTDSPRSHSPSRIGMLLNPRFRRHESTTSNLSNNSRSTKSRPIFKPPKSEPLLRDQDDYEINSTLSLEAQMKGSACLKNSMRSVSSKKMSKMAGRFGFDFGAYMMKFITRRLQSHRDDEKKDVVSSTGFVTFLDLATVTCAASAPISHKPKTLNVSVAPERRDIIWENSSRRADINESREFNANVSLVLGAVLWSVPLAGIQILASADTLAKIPGLKWIVNGDHESLRAMINSYLPVVALLTLILVLPYIFEAVAIYYERRKTLSEVNKTTVSRYFYYQLANIYISVTAGSIWISISEIIARPYAALEILGNTLPAVVGYFITLIVTKMLAGLPIIILRPYALFRYFFLRMIQRKKYMTQRELDNVYCLEPVYYGWEYPSQMLVITICFTYACISPIILIFGAMYFSAALMVYKKQVLYVYTPFYESGGDLFPLVCDRTVTGLICGQLTFMGYSIVRGGHILQVFSALPLISFTVWVMIYFRNHYMKPSKRLTLELAMELDRKIEERAAFRNTSKYFAKNASIPQDSFKPNYYRQPVMTERDGIPLFYRIDRQDKMTLEVREKLKRNELHVWEPKRNAVFGEDTNKDSKLSPKTDEMTLL